MEGYDNCNGDNSEVGGEAEPGEEGALVGAVVTAVRCDVGEQQGTKEWPDKEGDGCRSVGSTGEQGALVAERVHTGIRKHGGFWDRWVGVLLNEDWAFVEGNIGWIVVHRSDVVVCEGCHRLSRNCRQVVRFP